MKISTVFLIYFFASQAGAHSYLKQVTTKRSGSSTVLELNFTSPIETKFSKFEFFDPIKRSFVESKLLLPLGRSSSLQIALPATVTKTVRMRWNILSADGHRQRGEREIQIQNDITSH